MEVRELLGVRHGAGGVAELYVRALLGSLQHEGLVAEAVGKDDGAAFVYQIQRGLIALVGLGDVALDNQLIFGQSQRFDGFINAVDEVQVVGGIFVVKKDDAQLDVGNVRARRAGKNAQAQNQGQNHRKDLFHGTSPPCFDCFRERLS